MKNFWFRDAPVLLIFSLCLFSACGEMSFAGGGSAAAIPEYAAGNIGAAYDTSTVAEYPETARTQEAPPPAASGENPGQGRKLIKNADLRIRVEDLEAAHIVLDGFMVKYNAWTASSGIYANERFFSIRVPSDSYNLMLAELENLGRLQRRTENAEDVTLRYYDLESRLASKQELMKTYQSYLAKAATIDEIMTVENRIADLQLEIDQAGTRFRNLVNLVDYCTINVELAGPAVTNASSTPTLGERLSGLFGFFGEAASSVLVALAGIVIYGVPGILILVLLYWLLFGRVGLLKKLIVLAAGKRGR